MSTHALRAAAAPCLAAVLALSAFAVSAVPAHAATSSGTSGTTTSTAPAPTTPVPPASSDDGGSWNLVYRNDFTDLRDVTRFTSAATVNGGLSATDTSNNLLQKPTVAGDVSAVTDPAASDGSALGVFTQQATFATPAGNQTGWTSGRMSISGQNQAPPVRIRARIRMTPSIGAKTAVMWWPAGGGWPWEVDFAETFGGNSLTDFWGSRQNVQQNWHADLNHDGAATEQLSHTDTFDATQYHTYDLFILPTHMWVEIDGVKRFETYDTRWIPTGPGFFSIGKALTGSRSGAHTNDGVFLDWLEIYKINSPSVSLDPQSGPVGTTPTVTGTIATGGGDTTYHVDYGPTTAYGTSTPDVTLPGGGSVPVSVQLNGLSPASTYHYRLVATNASGTVSSSDALLTTGGVPTATASVVSMDAAAVTLASVVSTGGLPTTEAVQYSPVGGAPQSTPAVAVPATSASTTVTVPLTGLVPGTAYSFATTVSNAAGTSTGPVSTFVAPAAPTLSAVATVAQASTSLTVGAAVAPGNLPTIVHLDYGTTTAYGASAPDVILPAGTDPAAVTFSVPGLVSGQRYHYRIVASNADGSVTGPDALTGTTGIPVATLGKFSEVAVTSTALNLQVSGWVRANSLPTSYVVRYGVASKSARSSTAAVSVGSGLWANSVSSTLTGLKRHTCYRVTIEATNSAGIADTPARTLCTG